MLWRNPADGGLVFPEGSITGEVGEILDTGWDINWPGPGHVYLHEREISDIVVHSLDRPLIIEALTVNGWTPPGQVDGYVEQLQARIEEAEAQRDQALADKESLAQTIRIVQGDYSTDHELEGAAT